MVPPDLFGIFEAAICREQSRLSTIDDTTDCPRHVIDHVISVELALVFELCGAVDNDDDDSFTSLYFIPLVLMCCYMKLACW